MLAPNPLTDSSPPGSGQREALGEGKTQVASEYAQVSPNLTWPHGRPLPEGEASRDRAQLVSNV
jgi:hypothetical protein